MKKPIVSSKGQWEFPGERTVVPTPQGKITMKDVPYPVIGVDNMGASMMMLPGAEYTFPGNMVTEIPQMGKGGEMIKRKDGSYSRRGLWDNIRANKGSGKKPTKEMLQQERKIKAKMEYGGWLEKYQTAGEVDIIPTLKQLDPNFNVPKKTVNPLIKEALSSADQATDMLQLGHFSTLPWAQGAALIGDIAGASVDLAQSGISAYEGDKSAALGNLGMASVPVLDKSLGYERSRSLISGTSPGNYRPLSALTPAHAANPVIAKGLAWNKALLAANVGEIMSNMNSDTHATQRVPQRDNAMVKPVVRREQGGENWLDDYQEGGNTLAKYLKEPEPKKVIPSWLNMSSSLPVRAASMTPGADDFNLNDFDNGDISDDVKSLFENARVKFQTNKRLGSLGQIKIDAEAKPFAKEGSKLSLPNISMSNSVQGKNANLDYEIGADRQSFSLDSDGFIKGNANYNRQRTGEGFENSADVTLRFPNNRGNITRSVVYKDNESPSMSELRGNYRLGNTNINAFSKTEDGEQTYGAGLNTNVGPLNLSGNVGFDNDSLENYMVSGNLNLLKSTERNPNVGNLNLSARYGANRNQQGEMTPNYNIGLRYSNEFKNGGQSSWLEKYK